MTQNTLLGFDYGRKRIGVAVGQEITCTAQALTTLLSSNDGPDWAGIDRLIEQWRPQLLVVGLPHHMETHSGNDPHPLTEEIKAFGDQLGKRYNLPVDWIDERLSSVEAEALLAGSKKKKHQKQDKTLIDQIAAQIILQSYLNSSAS